MTQIRRIRRIKSIQVIQGIQGLRGSQKSVLIKHCFRLALGAVLPLNVFGTGALIVCCILSGIVLNPATCFAQSELQTLNVEGVSKAESPTTAASEIQNHAIEETARAQVIQMIGEKRYLKSKNLIESRVVRSAQAAKFMPYVQPGPMVKLPDGSWKMPLEIRFSVANLRNMILGIGLMNDTDGAASIVPLVSFVDRIKNVQMRWWMGEDKDDAHKFLTQLSRDFYEKFQSEFSRVGFHMIRPQGTVSTTLPEALRTERLTVGDLKSISNYYQAQLLMKGDVRIRESKDTPNAFTINVRIQVIQTQAARTVAELSRTFDTDAGVFEAVVRNKLRVETPEIAKDLGAQVMDVWSRGTINANLVKLAVRGTLTPAQLNTFKNEFSQTVKEVKSVRERMFEPGQVTFEIDYNGEPSQFVDRMKALQLAGFQMTPADLNIPRVVVMNVRSTSR